MSEIQDWRTRLEPLLSALMEGELTDADRAALDDILRAESEARQFYARYLFVHAALTWKQRGANALPADPLPAADFAAPQAAAAAPESIAEDPRRATTAPSQPLVTAGRSWKGLLRDFSEQPLAAAILVLTLVSGALLIWQLSTTRPQPVVQRPTMPDAMSEVVIARVTHSVDASWEMATPPVDGRGLLSGQKLALSSGLVEIAFESGASVILEGPAELILGGEKPQASDKPSQHHNACKLRQGKLVANVPPSAHGFTVITPSMKIVDLGTEFGAAVTRDKLAISRTEVQVFEGKVAIEQIPAAADKPKPPLAGRQPHILESGEAVTSDGSGPLQATNAKPARFVRELPSRPRLEALPTWPNDSPLKPGDIVAVTFKSMKVLKIDPETGEQQLLMQGRPYDSGQNDHGVSWHCVAVAPDGTLVVGIDGLSGMHAGLLRIDPRRHTIKVLASGGLLTMGQISGVAVAADGTIYAVYQAALHSQPEHILRIDPVSGAVTSIARMDHAFGICMAGQEHDALLTSDRAVVASWMHDGTISPWVAGDKASRCLSAAVSLDGRIFVAADSIPDLGERRILEVARSAGHEVRTVATLPPSLSVKPITGIWNIGVEFDGSLIVSPSEQDLRIYRVNPETGKSAVVSAGNLLEGRTAVAVVPGAGALTIGAPQN